MKIIGRLVLCILASILLNSFSATAQSFGVIKGKVIDSKTDEPIEYVNIAVLKEKDSTLAGGGISSENGAFSIEKIPEGRYLIKLSFIGYNTHIQSVNITKSNQQIQLGSILLDQNSHSLKGVEITAERSLVEYQLDKRVVNVDKDLVAGGGTATEVLESIPSVALDNDGNITLRGSSSVKILINGRPAELLGSDVQTVLEQIQANTIQNVEIITNPSAKYNPEGASGVINIKLKESRTQGLNGTVGLDFGSALSQFTPTTSGTLNLNYSTKKILLYGSVDGNFRINRSEGYSEIQRYYPNSDSLYSHIYQTEESKREGMNGSFKLGGEYYFNSHNSLNLSYQYRNSRRLGNSITSSIDSILANSDYSQTNDYNSRDHNHNMNLNYKKTFEEKDRELTLDAAFSGSTGKDLSTMEYENIDRDSSFLRESNAPETRYYTTIFLNYIHPFSEKTKLEAGYNGSFSKMDSDNRFYITTDGSSYFDTLTSNHYMYSENVNALYATLGHQFSKKYSTQLGLRYEYVSNKGNVNTHSFGSDPYGSLYPTIHFSYAIDSSQSLQLSYSRRVRRPSMWNMNPYRDVSNPERIRFGNPGLKPQYSNSIEASYNKSMRKANLFTSVYLRETSKMITNYSFPWNQENAEKYGFEWDGDTTNRIASTWLNLDKGFNYGVELIFDYTLTKWWKINISTNLYQSNIRGGEQEGNQSKNAFLWNAKLNSNFTLPNYWSIQFSAKYNAPWINLQGKMYEMYWADLALKKEVMNRKASISVRINDIFATLNRRFESRTDSFYNYSERKRLAPYASVGFTYKINSGDKVRNNRNRNNSVDDFGGGMDDF